ncbi:MAG TPA: hypothetical protein VGH33_14295 [Isosphaeraceae bacterium]
MTHRMTALAAGLLTILALGPDQARGQGAIAFQPVPAPIFDSANLGVTSAVSADRRYVRLGVNAGFQTVNGFTTLNIPVGLVSGGPGGFAGMNGPIGGGGGIAPAAMGPPAPAAPPVMTAASLGFSAPATPRAVPRSKRLRERAKAPVKPPVVKTPG